MTLRIELDVGTYPRQAGSEVVVPTGCADMPPAEGMIRLVRDNPHRNRERVRAL